MTYEEILSSYKLSEEEHNKIYEEIKTSMTNGKHSVEKPIAIIIGGQTGAGKSGIIGYSLKLFSDNNVVVINSDEIKPYHPKVEEIAKLYPNYFTKITDQESNTWTSRLFSELRNEHYNLIFEGTMWNTRVADDAIAELLKLGYTVIVRGIASGDLESKFSVLDRYVEQVKSKGFGRLVELDHHNKTYNGMPNTIDYIQKNGFYTILEIFVRGKKTISEPQLIYSFVNEEQIENIESVKNNPNLDLDKVSTETVTNYFDSAKQAVIDGRFESNQMLLSDGKLKDALFQINLIEDMPEIVGHIDDLKKSMRSFNKNDFNYVSKSTIINNFIETKLFLKNKGFEVETGEEKNKKNNFKSNC